MPSGSYNTLKNLLLRSPDRRQVDGPAHAQNPTIDRNVALQSQSAVKKLNFQTDHVTSNYVSQNIEKEVIQLERKVASLTSAAK